MLKKKLVNKWLAFALSVSIMSAGMSGIAVRAEEGGAPAESAAGVSGDVQEMDECPSGQVGEAVSEYGEILVISEKDENSESIARSKKEQKAAEKEAKKAEKEAEKEAKEKDEQKEQDKAEKEQQKEERKLAKKLDKEKHEKTSVINSVDDHEAFWNIVSVGSEEGGIFTIDEDVALDPVKVAILDSGVDYTEDIDVYMRKNFIPGEDGISVIYEDISGHGTSVAGIIAAKDNDEGITGINPYVQLYSARILDENKQAPASRVVAAIDWAIEQDVDIINISFGTTVDSEEIHAAIRRAYDAGILIVAAAGNNGVVEYPAAYDEVVAVGAVNAKGERTEGSAIGDELELVAPGQQIVSTGAFGGVCVVGGTSLAAPHVTAVASVLWQKDRSVSADFIRSLLAFTANQYGEDYEYGNGLVDLEFALSQFDAFREVYAVDADVLNEQVGAAVEDGALDVNEKPVEEFEDVVYVEGSWWEDTDGNRLHDQFAENGSMAGKLLGTDLAVVKRGALASDQYIGGMKIHSGWHGYLRNVEKIIGTSGSITYIRACANYVFSYIYLTEIAQGVGTGKSPIDFANTVTTHCIDPDVDMHGCKKSAICTDIAIDNIQSRFVRDGFASEDDNGSSTGVKSWTSLLGKSNEVNNRNKSMFIYGMALHAITDTFAHSSFKKEDGKWKIISHGDGGADDPQFIPNRLECASVASGYVIAHIKRSEVGSVEDFYKTASSVVYEETFKLGNLSKYIKAVDESYYNIHKVTFDKMSYDVRITP